MNEIIEHQNSSDGLGEYISGTLQHDAESLRARFATVPNQRLTTKLAFQTATKGVFRSLGAKLTMYAGAAAMVAALLYFVPKKAPEPVPASTPVPVPSPATVQPDPTPATAITAQNDPTASPALKPKHKAPLHKSVKVSGENQGNIPVITDPTYQDPLK